MTSSASPRRGLVSAGILVLVVLASLALPLPALGADPAAPAVDTATVQAGQELATSVAALQAQLSTIQQQQADLAARVAQSQQSLSALVADQAAVETAIGAADADLGQLATQYGALNAQVNALDARLAGLDAALAAGRQRLASRQRQLAADVTSAYQVAQTPLLDQLLGAGSLMSVLQSVSYYLDLGNVDAALAQQVAQDQSAVAQLAQSTADARAAAHDARASAEAAWARAEEARIALQAQQARYAALAVRTRSARSAQLAAFRAAQRNGSVTAATLAAETAALGRLKGRVDASGVGGSIGIPFDPQAQGQVGVPSSGTLAWPMPGVVSQPFGCTGFLAEPPLGSCAHFHLGIDIVAPLDTPIHAAADGVVLTAGPNPYDPPGRQAWIVVIAHAGGLLTWYAHVDGTTHPPLVHPGEVVRAGQVIAFEGDTGNATGPHLHWAVQVAGTFVDPMLFV